MASSRLAFEIMCPDAVDPAMQQIIRSQNIKSIVHAAQFAADQSGASCSEEQNKCQFSVLDDVLDDYQGNTERPDALTGLIYALMVKRSADIFQKLQERAYPVQQKLLRVNDQFAAAARAYMALRLELLELLEMLEKMDKMDKK